MVAEGEEIILIFLRLLGLQDSVSFNHQKAGIEYKRATERKREPFVIRRSSVKIRVQILL